MKAPLNRIQFTGYSVAAVLITAFASRTATWSVPAAAASESPDAAVASARVTNALDKVPLGFEANRGQTDRRVRFLSRGRGYALFLTGSEAVLSLKAADQPKKSTGISGTAALNNVSLRRAHCDVLRVRLEGANRNPAITGIDQLPGRANYFIGRNPRHWTTNVPTYEKVEYANVYPGIDLVYHGSSQHQLEYDFVVGAGRDPGAIELAFVGAESFRLNQKGDLILKLRDGEVVEQAPVIYQDTDQGRRAISGGYQLKGKYIAFRLGAYDKRKPLTIDPTLAYSTFLGGSEDDFGTGIAVDPQGDAYVTGYMSADFPTTPDAFQPVFRGPSSNNDSVIGYDADAFVTKLNRDGSALVYSTFLGGDTTDQPMGEDATDEAMGIALDSWGNAYITGATRSTNFPVTPNAYQPSLGGTGTGLRQNAFVSKLNADGSKLVYSTFLGGSLFDQGQAIAVDNAGNAYVGGSTRSADFPTTPGAFQPSQPVSKAREKEDAFVTKLNASGSQLVYSTYLGGTGFDAALSIALDSQGSAYITGRTGSSNFPTTPGAYQTVCANCGTSFNGFVTKLNADGSQPVYSTFLGGGFENDGTGIVVDGSGNAYVIGPTTADFPTTPGALVLPDQNSGAFVTKLNASGSQPVYSAFLGTLDGRGIAVNRQGNAYITGTTASTTFPTTPDAFQAGQSSPTSSNTQTIVARLNLDGSALDYSTYLGFSTAGNSLFTDAAAIALDCCGNAYVAGSTIVTSFPTTPGAYQTTYGGGGSPDHPGGGDVFVSKFKFEPPIIFAPASGSSVTGAVTIETQRNRGVKWLNVYVDGTHLASSPPFTFSWDSSKYAGGQHKISAVAYGYDNRESGSDEVTVTACNPAVKIDQPATGSSVSGIVAIDTQRTQEVQWINVYIDGKHLASSPPFSFQWDSTTVPDGTHAITAKGYRGASVLVGSASIMVDVQNHSVSVNQ
jgi:hypothetical protein